MKQDGFTLAEVLIALFLIGMGLLAVAPMFVFATQGNAVSEDFGSMGAIAVEQLEQLRSAGWVGIPAGGSLTTNSTGYFDNSNPDYIVRWTIADNVTRNDTKTIVVRVIATGLVTPGGQRKQITIGTVRGRG